MDAIVVVKCFPTNPQKSTANRVSGVWAYSGTKCEVMGLDLGGTLKPLTSMRSGALPRKISQNMTSKCAHFGGAF